MSDSQAGAGDGVRRRESLEQVWVGAKALARTGSCSALLVALVLAAPGSAFARAGSGSFSFGGGGGSGGFGGGGGGRGFGGHFPIFLPLGGGGGLLFFFLIAVLFVAASQRARRPPGTTPSAGLHVAEHLRAVQTVFSAINPFARRRRRKRQQRVELAAFEAAEDEPEFAPEVVHAEGERLFRAVQDAWSRDDRDRLTQLAGTELAHEWRRRLSDFARRGLSNEVSIDGPVEVDYIGLEHGSGEHQHVVVWISARLRDVVRDRRGREITRKESFGAGSRVSEYWTLGLRDGHWIVVSVEQEREGRHQLSEAIVATPWGDTERLSEEALVEQAAEERPHDGSSVAEIAPAQLDGNARAAALDLSLVDGRFAPDLLAAEVARAVRAWAAAVDGGKGELAELATPHALQKLLYPSHGPGQTRLVVRGPQVRELRIAALDAQATPAQMRVEFEVHGFRYIEDRDTTQVLAGSPHTASTFREAWLLTLDGDDAHPWRIAAV